MTVARVNINPDVLMWAIEYSQRGLEAFSEKFPKLTKWLEKSERPTVKQLEDMAKFAYVPFGYLMLSEKPDIPIRKISDFRTLQNQGFIASDEYSAALRDTINIVRSRQEWLIDYKKDKDYAPVAFIGSIDRNMSDDDIVNHINKVLEIPTNWRTKISSRANALRFFVDILESKGIVIFINGVVGNDTHRPLSVSEFRGFALADKMAPVIFINGADAIAARIFTLFHEVVHLFLGQDGLDDRTEPFCNRIAAKLLVPEDLFDKGWQKYAHDFEQLEKFFKVSQLVLFRAALTYNKIDEKEYARLVKLYESTHKRISMTGSGGDFYNVAPYRVGRGFCRYVNEAINSGSLTYTEAYNLLGVKGKTFAEVMKRAKEG